jgi:hypothetical protein
LLKAFGGERGGKGREMEKEKEKIKSSKGGKEDCNHAVIAL